MGQNPWTVAFVGSGDTTEANVKALLDDWMPEKDADGETRAYNAPIIPDQVKRTHKGLMRCWDWLSNEFKDEIEKLEPADIVSSLVADRDDQDDPSEICLVYVPGGPDDPFLPVVLEAIAAGIPVKDITKGLSDYQPPEAKPEETKPRRATRGQPRNAPKDDVPPWDEDDTRHAPGGSAKADAPAPSVAHEKPSAASTASPEPIPAPGVSVVLSQRTIDHLLATFASLAEDVGVAVHAQVVDGLPDSVKPKQVTHPYWVDPDGNYRVRERGRKRAGETAVDLTDDEVTELEKAGKL